MKRIFVSGRSGSGKTVALRALEDHGFYCVDNIPINLIPELLDETETSFPEIAIGIDSRNIPKSDEAFGKIMASLSAKSRSFQVVYIDANDTTLLKRFSETRRRHPLTVEGLSLAEAISAEKERLEPVARYADLVIDTTSKTPHELCETIANRVLGKEQSQLSIEFKSFGFKSGAPTDSDYVFDARCLPNPYWQPELRAFNGKEKPISDFLNSEPIVQEYYWQVKTFLYTWIPHFEEGNRTYLTIAIGCTGGQHRSVFLVEKLAHHFAQSYKDVKIRHRELDKKQAILDQASAK